MANGGSLLRVERLARFEAGVHHVDKIMKIAQKCHGIVGIEVSPLTDDTIALALCVQNYVVLINVNPRACRDKVKVDRLKELLVNVKIILVGAYMSAVLLRLLSFFGISGSGVDLGSALKPLELADASINAFRELLRSTNFADEEALLDAYWPTTVTASKEVQSSALRAWMSHHVSAARYDTIIRADRLSLDHLLETERQWLLGWQTVIDAVDAERPTSYVNDFETVRQMDGTMVVQNARYKNRIRAGKESQTRVEFKEADGQILMGRPLEVTGKRTTVEVEGSMSDILSITVLGKEGATLAEQARDRFILNILKNKSSLSTVPFIRLICFPTNEDRVTTVKAGLGSAEDNMVDLIDLNDSQRKVAMAMLADSKHQVVLSHGPPGTGKTRTISAVVKTLDAGGKSAWLVAQTNVGVKNMAESLMKNGCHQFRIIVSREFMFEWHDHLYRDLFQHVIRSDFLRQNATAQLAGCRIILCTLNMLSNPDLDTYGIFLRVPVERLIIDEASQIYVGDYLHLFDKFSSSLEKICWFGDPKQLPPYGQEVVQDLKSVFDIKFTRPFLLDTQYRMPTKIGEFISKEIYDGCLRSVHTIRQWDCLSFVDISNGREERDKKSFKNMEEVQAIVDLVRYYYHRHDWCCLTLYDAQRAQIENALKTACLEWERKVFNVDSFQGNEAPFIIISLVRTKAVGFLKNKNRLNVMLTRCQSGMVIVAAREFLRTTGKYTLVSKLAQSWESTTGKKWVSCKDVADMMVDLPGVRAPFPKRKHVEVRSLSNSYGPSCGKSGNTSSISAEMPSGVIHSIFDPHGSRSANSKHRGVQESQFPDAASSYAAKPETSRMSAPHETLSGPTVRSGDIVRASGSRDVTRTLGKLGPEPVLPRAFNGPSYSTKLIQPSSAVERCDRSSGSDKARTWRLVDQTVPGPRSVTPQTYGDPPYSTKLASVVRDDPYIQMPVNRAPRTDFPSLYTEEDEPAPSTSAMLQGASYKEKLVCRDERKKKKSRARAPEIPLNSRSHPFGSYTFFVGNDDQEEMEEYVWGDQVRGM